MNQTLTLLKYLLRRNRNKCPIFYFSKNFTLQYLRQLILCDEKKHETIRENLQGKKISQVHQPFPKFLR